MKPFKQIGIIGRPGSAKIVETLKRLKCCLLEGGYNVILEQNVSLMLPGHELPVLSSVEIGKRCDLAVIVGGDGSMLGAARALAGSGIPVLGINRGNLGFLTDISSEHLEEQIAGVLNGDYTIEKRFLLDISIFKQGQLMDKSSALNEIVLHPVRFTRMIEFELFINDQFVMSQKSDGIIIATPTGSTAYALSAGGPIMHPELSAIALIPMYPHTLSDRPLVIDGDSTIKIRVSKTDDIYSQISCDGQLYLNTSACNELHIRKKQETLLLIHPLNHNYYEVCRTKLGWGHRLDNRKNNL